MKNKKLLTNILFAAVVLAIAAVLLAVRSHNATGGKLAAQLIYGDNNAVLDIPLRLHVRSTPAPYPVGFPKA